MTDLRKALDNLGKVCPYFPGDQELLDESIKALRQALAEPEQEPVGYVTPNGTSAWIIKYVELDYDTPLYAAPPHYWGNVSNEELVEELRRRDMLMVPVKREWVELTNEDIHNTEGYEEDRKMFRFAKSLLAKAKEKNT